MQADADRWTEDTHHRPVSERLSDTTLFEVAMRELGDALHWVALARLNGLTSPWIIGEQTILIPPVLPSGQPTGILGL